MDYYSAFERKKMAPSTTWTKLENIILSEISQSQKDKSCVISNSYKVPRVIEFIETESRMAVTRGRKKQELLFNGYRAAVWGC